MTQVSIVIPTFNRSMELPRTIDSVCKQRFADWELLIIDDGSTDTTEDVVKAYIKKDSRISFYKRPDSRQKGANACRNIGIEKAVGTYIAMLDSDDEWTSERLSEVMTFLKESGKEAIYSGAKVFDGDSYSTYESRSRKPNENYVDFLFAEDTSAATPTLVFLRENGLEVKFDETLLRHQDIDFFIRYGDEFGWDYFENYDVIINWEKGKKKTVHFESMVAYFERYKNRITQTDVVAQYLLRNWILARKYDPKFQNYYVGELKKINGLPLKYRIFTWAPKLVYSIWKILLKQD